MLSAVVRPEFATVIVYSTNAFGIARGLALPKPSSVTSCDFVTVSAAD